VTSIGDLNGDGVTDLAVGANADDDGGTNRGAVWILFLNTSVPTITTSVADLSVTKQVNLATVPGGTIFDGTTFNYTINVANAGPSTAENVILNDVLPDEVTFVSSDTPFSLLANGPTFDLGSIASGGSTPIEIKVTVDGGFSGDLTNIVNVTSSSFDPTPDNATSISKFGLSGIGDGQLNFPRGVAVNSTGYTYVSDTFNSRIQVFDPAGNFVLMFGFGVNGGGAVFETCTSTCTSGISGTGTGQFDRPRGVAIDSADNIIVADYENHRIQVFDPTGTFVSMFGFDVAVGGGTGFEICTSSCKVGIQGYLIWKYVI